ncbi:MAG: MerR family transcriptional regulator [Alphaproteobacteria bacterium]|nr:MAG: MerR family transcriptional regulator [Alphaproteobacteria bacterium]
MALAKLIAEELAQSKTLADSAEKSKSAFRTITEVADELRLEAHVLRFWETKFTKIKPVKMRGGRRYYRPEDIRLIKDIKHLLYDKGYTIRGVQKILGRKASEETVVDTPPETSATTAIVASKIVEPQIPQPANNSVPGITEEDVQRRVDAAVQTASQKLIESHQSQVVTYQSKINSLQEQLDTTEQKLRDVQNGIKPLLEELNETRGLIKKSS